MDPPAYTVIDVYKILPQTNCGKCLLPSCLAFAAAVVAGRKKLGYMQQRELEALPGRIESLEARQQELFQTMSH